MNRRVVVTGLGVVTALGEGMPVLWRALLEGRSGIAPLDFGNGWKPLGASFASFEPEKFISQRKAIKVMARDIQLACAGAKLALEDAGIHSVSLPKNRIGVIVGSGVLNHDLDELAASVAVSTDTHGHLDLKKFGEEGISNLFPLWLLKYLPNMSACHISILFNLEGPNNTITTGPSGGLQAVEEAARIIQRGAAEVMLAGGAESKTNPVGLSQYQVMGVLANGAAASEDGAYCVLDRDSGGIIPGEAAAFLVLEEKEHAKKRGARIYAEIAGMGQSSQTGRMEAMHAAISDAGISAKDISYVQAAGLGLPEEDGLELEAIEKVMGQRAGRNLSASASKPVTGFTGFASGALDLSVSAMALSQNTLPPILHLKNPALKISFELVCGAPQKKLVHFSMTNTFGLGGQCACVVLKKPEGNEFGKI